MRYVAIDVGQVRTGFAVGDSITGVASPVDVIQVLWAEDRGEALLKVIDEVVVAHLGPAPRVGGRSPGEIVIGLPLNMDGTEGQPARLVREFGERIARHTGRVVHFQDERLTSADADWSLAKSGLTHKQKKRRRDSIAAAAILNDFLAQQQRQAAGAVGDEGNRAGSGTS